MSLLGLEAERESPAAVVSPPRQATASIFPAAASLNPGAGSHLYEGQLPLP